MMRISFEVDSPEELGMIRDFLNGVSVTEKRPMTNAEKQKAYRERKKAQGNSGVTEEVTESNTVTTGEEREEERVLPLDSPSSLPSSPLQPPINYPITPFNPPLPKEEEREEETQYIGARGKLKHFAGSVLVLISEKEYNSLIEKFGKEKADRMILNMDSYLLEDKKRQTKYKTRDHYRTLLNWERRNEERKQEMQPVAKVSNIPKRFTAKEIGAWLDLEESKNADE